MFLSKLPVNVVSRKFRRDIANVHDMHRTVMDAFPSTDQSAARSEHGVLWRLDRTTQGYVLYVQSRIQPNWDRLPENYLSERGKVRCLQPVLQAIRAGTAFRFRIVANPTRRLKPQNDHRNDGNRRHNRRVPLHRPGEQTSWLVRQAEQRGFVLPAASTGEPDVTATPLPDLSGRQKDTPEGMQSPRHNKITIAPVRFDGRLVVTDPDQLVQTISDGIGPAKAYGCGLMSLAPVGNGAGSA
ncbi:CRISPR system Cascade subunit CasE [Actinopolyspora lacussalsi subsp. righensis]|uniref:CRISPR system Cascade subunit CasE n=1 Tax=Actinopolyspora righensis TaxID=995060 RepID=A0A1I6XG39_9ACTN|nr:type I-E CRISPR-associated protein Cas6/Cse3/CasE [Actinopolyspora righensis]SFT37096.1 CRISPR system Cascade subunit CasE [Actinopolyspora righensis]